MQWQFITSYIPQVAQNWQPLSDIEAGLLTFYGYWKHKYALN
jgi:hypothetical protein